MHMSPSVASKFLGSIADPLSVWMMNPVYEVTLTYWSEKYENMIYEMDAILAEDEYNVQFHQEQNVDQNDINGL